MELPNFLLHYLRLIIEMWNELLNFSSGTEDASWLSGLNSHYIILPFAKVRVKPGGVFCSGKAPYRLNGILSELKREGGEKEKERKSHRIYLTDKAYFSSGIIEGSSADLQQLKPGTTLYTTVSSCKLWPGWSGLHSVLSFRPTRAMSCLSPRAGHWFICHYVDLGVPQSCRWRRQAALSSHLYLWWIVIPQAGNQEEGELFKHFSLLAQHSSESKYMDV